MHLLNELNAIPDKVAEALQLNDHIKMLAKKYAGSKCIAIS